MKEEDTIAVVIPCYRVKKKIMSVIDAIGSEVAHIYVVDDCCPEGSGRYVEELITDNRVRVVYNKQNMGVGGATMAGFARALKDGCSIIVKVDGDGQMNPAEVMRFVTPLLEGRADYTKGNRFYNLEDVVSMPVIRLIGNASLSFLSKLSTGYWNSFDPTNGFLAIHARVLSYLPLHKIDQRYFFETDMLFRLNTLRAVVLDIPMTAIYRDEQSSLKISKEAYRFLGGHSKNLIKRIFYNYFLRDFSAASLELLLGIVFVMFGTVFGIMKWVQSSIHEVFASTGTVMLSALPIIIGTQLLLAFLNFDIASSPKSPIHKHLQKLEPN